MSKSAPHASGSIVPGNLLDWIKLEKILCGTIGELQDANECIIKIKKHDIDGTIMMYLSENGFQLKDTQRISEENFWVNETLLKVKYRVIILIICFVGAYTIFKAKSKKSIIKYKQERR